MTQDMTHHGWPAPEAGDIVWCPFPHNRGIEPGPKPRPALVVKVFEDIVESTIEANARDTAAPGYIVLVAYGTSQKTDQLRSGEFLIAPREAAAYQLAGLSYATKFSFRSTVELPYNSEWFKVPPGAPHGQIPRLGVLHPSLMLRVRAAWDAAQD